MLLVMHAMVQGVRITGTMDFPEEKSAASVQFDNHKENRLMKKQLWGEGCPVFHP
jgi:hypothetical protein